MRLKVLIPTFILSLAILSVDAIQRPRKSRLAQHSVVSQRQYRPSHVSARDLIDICVNLDAIIGGNQLLEDIFGDVHLCLCLKDLDIFLNTYVILDLLGLRAVVTAELNNILGTQPPCPALPAHAHRACTTADPCHYTCDDSFTEIGSQCVCAAPKTICNGVCGNFPHGCTGHPSPLPRSLKKRAAQEFTFADAQAYCGEKRVCGIPSATDDYAFECIDTRTSSESCGGCMTAHPWAQSTLSSRGLDCTAIQSRGLAHRCENGECVADSCPPGADGCAPSTRVFPRLGVPVIAPSTLPNSRSVIFAPGPIIPPVTSSSSLSAGNPRFVSTDSSSTTGVTSNSIDDSTNGLDDAVSNRASVSDIPDLGSLSNPTYGLTDGLGLDSSTVSLDSLSSYTPSGLTDGLGLDSDVSLSSASLSRDADCDCEDSPPPPPSNCPSSAAESSSSWSSSNSGLLNGVLKALGLRKRQEKPCEGAPPASPPPSLPPPPSTTEPCDESTSSSVSKPTDSGVGASGNEIVANLEPLAAAGVNAGSLNEPVVDLSKSLGLGGIVSLGKVTETRRSEGEEDCHCEDGGSTSSSVTIPLPSTTPSLTSSVPSSTEPCDESASSIASKPTDPGVGASGNEIVANLEPLAIAGVNVGSLNKPVVDLSKSLGLGGIISLGKVTETRRSEGEEDCHCEDGGSTSSSVTIPLPSTPPSLTSSVPSSTEPCDQSASSSASKPTDPGVGASGNEIVANLEPLAIAGVNVGSLNKPVVDLSKSLGLGGVISLGKVTATSRSVGEDDCHCEDGGSSSSSSPSSGTSALTPPAPSSTEPCDEPVSSSASTPADSGVGASGKEIVANLEPLAIAGVDVGSLNKPVVDLSKSLGLGGIVSLGKVTETRRSVGEDDCHCEDGGSSSSSPPPPSGTSALTSPAPSSTEPCDEPVSSSSSTPPDSGVGASGKEIVANLEPLAIAGVNVGSLNEPVVDLSKSLGLGGIISLGKVTETRRSVGADDCHCEDSGSSSSSSPPSGTSALTPPAPSSSEPCDEPVSSSTSASVDSGDGASGKEIVANLEPLAIAGVNVGSLNKPVVGLLKGLGLGGLISLGSVSETANSKARRE